MALFRPRCEKMKKYVQATVLGFHKLRSRLDVSSFHTLQLQTIGPDDLTAEAVRPFDVKSPAQFTSARLPTVTA